MNDDKPETSIVESLIDSVLTSQFDIEECSYGIQGDASDKGFLTYPESNGFSTCLYVNGSPIKFNLYVSENVARFRFGVPLTNSHTWFDSVKEIHHTHIYAINIFNNVMYILFELVDKLNVDSIAFEGFSNSLNKVYKVMVKNENVLSKIQSKGWVYDNQNDDVYIFKKKGN